MIDPVWLLTALQGQSLPVSGVTAAAQQDPNAGGITTWYTAPDGSVAGVTWTTPPSAGQQTTAQGVVASYGAPQQADHDLGNLSVPVKTLAAMVVALNTVPASVKNSWPAWVQNVIANAATRVNTVIAGRTPTNT